MAPWGEWLQGYALNTHKVNVSIAVVDYAFHQPQRTMVNKKRQ
ncbi:MAG: hypothetical protein PWQ27_1109 [Kosmotoga sp.]|nr:hypothetical protein [Kosmotoga sp.]